MFVNYCGSRKENIESHIRAAVSECRSKRGYMLQSVIFSTSIPRNLSVSSLKAAQATA
jgi:hypothetical protein